MREILFRGKEAETGKWIYGWVFGEKAKSIIELDKGYIGKEGVESYYTSVVIPETVGQYTGLDDKNGVRIFEGDINVFKTVYSTGRHVGEIRYYNECKPISRGRHLNVDLAETNKSNLEVIGNIHDNPELMEWE